MNHRWRIIGELIAVISVVLSLAFVGFELRISSAIARTEAFNSFRFSLSEHDRIMATDPLVTPIMVQLMNGATASELDQVDEFRVRNMYGSLLQIYDGLYRSYEEGLLDREDLEIVGGGGAFRNSYFRDVWIQNFRYNYSQGFVEMIESLSWNQE